jgi:hypothetical protein
MLVLRALENTLDLRVSLTQTYTVLQFARRDLYFSPENYNSRLVPVLSIRFGLSYTSGAYTILS